MVKEFVLPCLLLLMSCAGSKSEHCEPNFASQAQIEWDHLPMNMTALWILKNSRGSSCGFQQVSSSTLWFSKRGPNGLRHPRRGQADSRHYLGMRSFVVVCGQIPKYPVESQLRDVVDIPFHLYHISRCIEAHIWSRCEILLDLSFKSSKLRSTVAQFVNAILQKHCLQYHLLRFCLRCRLLGALKSPLSWHDQVESLLTLEHPRGSYAIHRRSCNLEGKHLKKLRSKGRPSDCARAPGYFQASLDQEINGRNNDIAKTRPSADRYTGNAEDRTSLAQLSAKIKAKFVCIRKSWHDNGINRTETSKLLWVLVGLDIWPCRPSSQRQCQITCELGLLFEDPRRCGFQLVHLLHHQGLPLHCVWPHECLRDATNTRENVCHPYPRIIGPVRTTIQFPGCQAWRSCAAGEQVLLEDVPGKL